MGDERRLSPFLHRRAEKAYLNLRRLMRDVDNDTSMPDDLELKRAHAYAMLIEDVEVESFASSLRIVRAQAASLSGRSIWSIAPLLAAKRRER